MNEISTSECAACFGLYEEDLSLTEDWVECTNCEKWMHSRCVQLDDQELKACCVCSTLFQ